MVLEGTLADPVVVGAVAVVAVAVATVGVLAVRVLGRSKGARFRKVLAGNEAVAVLLHPNPDPDAMACGMATATIADSVDTETTLYHAGAVRHQENRAFKNLLDLDLESIDGTGEIAEEAVVLVDHNAARGFPGAGGIEPIAVVDHHGGEGTGSAFTDVRTDYGAAATIFAEYLESLEATVGENGNTDLQVSPELATGLVYGILSDTNDLTRGASPAEFAACAYLYEAVDPDLLDRIAHPEVPEEVLQSKADAIRNRRVEGSSAICGLGEVPVVDAIPQAADELVQLEGVTAAVVYGEKEGTLHLSGRSRDDRIHMGEALEAAVAEIPMAEAGGHHRMGGGQLSVDHMNGIGPSEGISTEEFETRVLAALDGDLG